MRENWFVVSEKTGNFIFLMSVIKLHSKRLNYLLYGEFSLTITGAELFWRKFCMTVFLGSLVEKSIFFRFFPPGRIVEIKTCFRLKRILFFCIRIESNKFNFFTCHLEAKTPALNQLYYSKLSLSRNASHI